MTREELYREMRRHFYDGMSLLTAKVKVSQDHPEDGDNVEQAASRLETEILARRVG